MTMECNKEEAMRAKDIAKNKMRVKDFMGARKIVIKAQQLYPELENISQMLTVCAVHCCAVTKINGETDWYAILQIEQTTEEETIKKQYRKLALLLHPDKNKFEGAEATFKLVGEAQRTLSDPTKHSLHNIKKRTIFRTVQVKQPAQQPNRSSAARKQPGVFLGSNVEDCEYDLVEILGRGVSGVKCGRLIKVDGHRYVFMPERHTTTEIPASDYLRFSDQVPAFRLTEERGGKLRGYWELDPASVPQI